MAERSPIAKRAERLLSDRTFNEAFDDIDALIVKQLAETQLQPDTEGYVLEMVRRLQAHRAVRKWLRQRIQYGDLKEANFKPREVAQ